jgi:hypothetical protein
MWVFKFRVLPKLTSKVLSMSRRLLTPRTFCPAHEPYVILFKCKIALPPAEGDCTKTYNVFFIIKMHCGIIESEFSRFTFIGRVQLGGNLDTNWAKTVCLTDPDNELP